MNIEATRLLAVFTKMSGKYRTDLFQKFNLKSVHYGYLRAVYFNEGISQDRVAREVYSDKGNVTRQLNYLKDQGYIIIKNDPDDGRRHGVYLTDEGRKVFREMMKLESDFNKLIQKDLKEDELKILNNLVSGYFDLAEISAIEHKPMYMSDYVAQLDSILSSGNRKLLEGPGNVSNDQSLDKAKREYRKYQEITLSPVEEEYLKSIKGIEKEVKKKNTKP